MKRFIFYILSVLLLIAQAHARDIGGDEIRHGLGVESETAAYMCLNPGMTTAQIMALNDQVVLIKYGSGITISSVTGNISNVANYYFLTNFSTDIRAYSGFYATLTDTAAKTKKVLLGAVGAGETTAELIATDDDRTFDSDTGFWTKGTGVTITGGKVVVDGSGVAYGNIIQRANFLSSPIGKLYKGVYSIFDYTSGKAYESLFSTTTTPYRSAIGTFTDYRTCPSNGNGFLQYASGNIKFSGSISDVSFSQVLAPSASGGCWFTPVSEDADFNPNSVTFTVAITRS